MLNPLFALLLTIWQPGPVALPDNENSYVGSVDTPAAGAALAPDQPLVVSGLAGPPVNAVVAPTGGEEISRKLEKYTIRGYALDPTASVGTGIDRVQVYMDEPRGQGGTLVGGTEFGGSTPQAAAQYG